MKLSRFLRNKFYTPTRRLSVYLNGYCVFRGLQRNTRNNVILEYFKDYDVVKIDGLKREFVIFIREDFF